MQRHPNACANKKVREKMMFLFYEIARVILLENVLHRAVRLVCVVSMLVLGSAVAAQSVVVYGTITDGRSHEPLMGAYIEALGTKANAVSDAIGHYRIMVENNANVRLRTTYVGYGELVKLVKINGKDSVKLDLTLMPDEHTLHDVTVTARSEARKIRESAMPVSVISQRQLQGTATNINDVLARTVGVTVRNTGGMGSASRISVRGLEGKRMGLFVDETPLAQIGNFVALNDIPTSMIERIEVYKGIVPYKFGGSALGGAVNVVTKEYPPVYLDVAYEISSFNTHQLSTVLKRTNARTGLQFGVGGVLTHSDNDYTMRLENLNGRVVKRDHDKFDKAMGGFSLKATKWWFDEIKTELIFTRTKQQIQGIDMPVKEAYNESKSLVSALKLKRENFFVDGLDFDLDAGYVWGWYGMHDTAMHRYDWDGTQLPPVSGYGGEQGNHPTDGKNRSQDFIAKLNMGYTLNEHHELNLNVYENYTRLAPKDTLMDRALNYHANFPSNMNNLTVGFSHDLTLFGGRFQNALTLKAFFYSSHSRAIEVFGVSDPEPVSVAKSYMGFSDAMRYKFTPYLMLKASFNSEVRIPTSEELIGNGYSILPSPTLKPERTTGTNLGLLYRRQSDAGQVVECELNGFYNVLHDMVRFTPDIIPTMARYRNFGNVRTVGVELDCKADVLPWAYLYANGTWQDLRDTRRMLPDTQVDNPTYNKRIPNVPYLMGNFGVELHKENLFGGKGQNTRLLFDASYVHQYFYDFEMSIYQDRKIPTSFTMDAGLEHSFGNGRWTLTFKLKNITDRWVVSELNRPLPGRTLAFKVRYVLK